MEFGYGTLELGYRTLEFVPWNFKMAIFATQIDTKHCFALFVQNPVNLFCRHQYFFYLCTPLEKGHKKQ
jgi:hypothetical protein